MAEPLAKLVGIPDEVVAQMRQAPFRPALVIAGGASARFMPASAEALAAPLPDGRPLTLEGQSYDIDPTVLGPVLREFLVLEDTFAHPHQTTN